MSKQCAKCTKTVFPVEELKCLDKVWHKGCFRCQECNMSLNMKNYKGYNKLPYCNAHYPKTTHTVVAETPETRRIAENTKIQSNIQYHKDFEMSKDQFTPVVDTPDLKRVRDNTKNISLIEYQKEFTSQRGSCKQISDTVEMRTHSRNTDNFSTVKYHAEFEKSKGAKISIADDPETKRVRKNMETISNISYHGDLQKRNQMEMNRPVEQDDHVSRRRPGSTGDYEPRGRQPGSINDYDPTANQGGTPYSQRQSQGTAVYDSRTGVVYENPMAYQGGNYQYQGSNAPQQAPQQQGGSAPGYAVWQPPSTRVAQPQQARQPAYQPPPQQQQQQPYRPPGQPQRNQVKYKAMYDYTAADDDEVSFREDDYIVNCEIIDAGWMEGTVERTGQRGMLPSNYVEKCS